MYRNQKGLLEKPRNARNLIAIAIMMRTRRQFFLKRIFGLHTNALFINSDRFRSLTNPVINVKMNAKVIKGNVDFVLSLGATTGFVKEP